MENRDNAFGDRMLDQLAHLVLAIAGIIVIGVALGAGIVMFEVGSWAYASEITLWFTVSTGVLVTLIWLFRLYRDR